MVIKFFNYTITTASGPVEFEACPTILNTNFYIRATSMQRKEPLQFNTAIDMIYCRWNQMILDGQISEAMIFFRPENIVQFISDQGFHIEWTGDEFVVLDQKLAC